MNERLSFNDRTYQLKRGPAGANATAVMSGTEQPLLPLWGQLCCNLMAEPECATTSRITGFINIQVNQYIEYRSTLGGVITCSPMLSSMLTYCFFLFCFFFANAAYGGGFP